jgi:hypothetical protein
MRLLAQPKVLTRAGAAALITALACYPRLATWSERIHSVLFLWLMLLWAVFILWAFVFAWQNEYARRPVLGLDFRPKLWVAATLCGLAWAVLLHFLTDPQLRVITPQEYPTDLNSWLAMSLFAIVFNPLFLCFAPFAFFVRLSRKVDVSVALTVLFGVLVLYLRLHYSPVLPPAWFVVALMVLRITTGFLSVYFYLKGGAMLVWWVALILQLRHLLDLRSS